MYDVITPDLAQTLAGLFQERVRRSPGAIAYRYYDAARTAWQDCTWADTATLVGRWQAALQKEGYAPGDRIAIMLRNGVDWVACDLAASGLGLVVVPLYAIDRAENAAYIIADAGAKFLLIEGQDQWRALRPVLPRCTTLTRIISVRRFVERDTDIHLVCLDQWLPAVGALHVRPAAPDSLATIVYTSGTTGAPKGVMLSHHNILWNAHACLQAAAVRTDDVFLSFLPLSHTLERTVGYYLPMMAGASVAHARSITQLAEDFLAVRPTVVISVPRVFERVAARVQAQLQSKSAVAQRLFRLAVDVGWQRFERQQGRARWQIRECLWPLLRRLVGQKILDRMGGRLRLAICGGARLAPETAHVFLGLGLPLLQGYGMTETSPVVSTNVLDDNDPASVGRALPDVEVRVADNGEFLVRGPGVTLGYWGQAAATAQLIDAEGWLHSGDQARIKDGRIYITGRIKEIIVLANGEKVPPADMEAAITADPMFEQVMVVGEGRPYLCALVVLSPDAPRQTLAGGETETQLLDRIAQRLSNFPGYAQVRRVAVISAPWTVENDCMTPSLKLRRARILEHHHAQIDALYSGH